MMRKKLQFCSDLHLEFNLNSKFINAHPLKPVGDILLLAGDIVPFAVMGQCKDFFDFVADNYEITYWLPGNHEYYSSDISVRSGVLNEAIRSNVFLVNNHAVLHQDTKLIFTTLWSEISPANEWQIERGMSDFHVIKDNGYRLGITSYNNLHKECKTFLKEELDKPHVGETIVVTHHVPTFMNYPKQYKGSILSEGFATEMHDFIEASNITHWIYGHHHSNTPDFTIGNTQMLTNQLGYVKHGEHQLFRNDRVIHTQGLGLPLPSIGRFPFGVPNA
jgi:predicted phosphohydrolase